MVVAARKASMPTERSGCAPGLNSLCVDGRSRLCRPVEASVVRTPSPLGRTV
jgi:hypothetical protein